MSTWTLLAQVGAAPEPPHGATLGGTLGTLALVAIVLAVVGLVLVEFVFKSRLARTTYRWTLLLGLFVLPGAALLGTTGHMFEEMKTVPACGSCHVMEPFIADMREPGSASLAARHFRSGAIPDKQCYACHTGYGIFGTMESKRDGFRHWLLYVTDTWQEPITYKGTYPNANCLGCHAAGPAFTRVDSHRALREQLTRDEMSCFTCHGLPHPARPTRGPTRVTSHP
jgi:nitrate/TMAO reductase-like tetraheme cytochrome c subunit